MVIERFPPVESADEHGILAAGGDLEPESLLLAYSSGIFPWPHGDLLLWFSPPERCIIEFSKFHVSRSLKKFIRQNSFSFRRGSAFAEVMQHCAQSSNRKRGGDGTWITNDIQSAYQKLFKLGYAESFETYENGKLCGGLYGVRIGNYFAGESMFYLRPNASKLAMLYAISELRSEGLTWLDCQVSSPHLVDLGASVVDRSEFLKLLKVAIRV
jgi:leucyl/phenylalanyl-tRNA---protein transferase